MKSASTFERKDGSAESKEKARPVSESYDEVPGLAGFMESLRTAYPKLSYEAFVRILGLPNPVQKTSTAVHGENKEEK